MHTCEYCEVLKAQQRSNTDAMFHNCTNEPCVCLSMLYLLYMEKNIMYFSFLFIVNFVTLMFQIV